VKILQHTVLIKTLPPKSDSDTGNGTVIFAIFLFFIAIMGLITIAADFEKEDNLKTVKAHAEYYNNFGVNEDFWKILDHHIEKHTNKTYHHGMVDIAKQVSYFRVRLSNEIEYPRYMILGEITPESKGKFIPNLRFTSQEDAKYFLKPTQNKQ
jgi:hypothetical protein